MRLFASIRVHSRLSLPTLHFAIPWHLRPARPLFIINFNLHARHFTSPGWTNTVQAKNYFSHAALDCCRTTQILEHLTVQHTLEKALEEAAPGRAEETERILASSWSSQKDGVRNMKPIFRLTFFCPHFPD